MSIAPHLAQKLKEAGFPILPEPTIEQLLAALGHKFFFLQHVQTEWTASSGKIAVTRSTPQDALAALWLETL